MDPHSSNDPLNVPKQVFEFLIGRIAGESRTEDFELAINSLAELGNGDALKPEIRAEFLTLKMCALIRATSRVFASSMEARGQEATAAKAYGRGIEGALVALFDQNISSRFPPPRFPAKWPSLHKVSLTYFEVEPVGFSPSEDSEGLETPRDQFSFALQSTLKGGLHAFLHQDLQVAEVVVEAALRGRLDNGAIRSKKGLVRGDGTLSPKPAGGMGCALLALGPPTLFLWQLFF
jgi:hypothetical protein